MASVPLPHSPACEKWSAAASSRAAAALGEAHCKRACGTWPRATPALKIKVGGQPCAPSLTFQLGDDSAATKALCIRGMLHQGFLFSGQLYAMWPHDETMIADLLSAWDEVLGGLDDLQQRGALRETAGSSVAPTGFARLA